MKKARGRDENLDILETTMTSAASLRFLLVTALCLANTAPAQAAVPVDQGYLKLSGREIRAFFKDKIFTDGTHFSGRYEADGKIDGFAMGRKVSNTWKVRDGNLCITDSVGELCYAVWKKGSDVALIQKDSDITIYGSLRSGIIGIPDRE